MKEYIEREAVMKEFANFVWDSNHSDLVPAPQWNHAIDIVRDFPAADVRPVVRGKWEKSYADHEAFGVRPFFRYCSVCNEATVHPYNYCPHCGAEMKGKENG